MIREVEREKGKRRKQESRCYRGYIIMSRKAEGMGSLGYLGLGNVLESEGIKLEKRKRRRGKEKERHMFGQVK